MFWRQLWACIHKEILLLGRDKHGLALLFVMPVIFILIMSLALQNEFAARGGKRLDVLVLDADHSAASGQMATRLTQSGAFAVQVRNGVSPSALVQPASVPDPFAFSVTINKGYEAQLSNAPAVVAMKKGPIDPSHPAPIELTVAADTGRQTEMIFRATLREIMGRQRIHVLLEAVRNAAPELQAALGEGAVDDSLMVRYAYRSGSGTAAPSAVQQNVPAWLVFGVFFVAIPLSNTLIRERQLGTLRRLRTTAVGGFTLLAGKWLTFFAVNQLQVISMLAVGVYLVPLLGGQALLLQGSLVALALISVTLSVAALGYALLIAAATRTTEQATLLGGAGNIVLAAIGGIMVPKFVMPGAMQTATNLSPMAWGLQGFLDVLLRGSGCVQVLPKALALLAFGAIALALAWLLQQRRTEQ